jgi:hypothetical protein
MPCSSCFSVGAYRLSWGRSWCIKWMKINVDTLCRYALAVVGAGTFLYQPFSHVRNLSCMPCSRFFWIGAYWLSWGRSRGIKRHKINVNALCRYTLVVVGTWTFSFQPFSHGKILCCMLCSSCFLVGAYRLSWGRSWCIKLMKINIDTLCRYALAVVGPGTFLF